MRFPQRIELFYVPAQLSAEAHVVALTDAIIKQRMNAAWWADPAIRPELAAKEIDRNWDWVEQKIEYEQTHLSGRKLGVLTGDGAIQGAMLISAEPVPCEREPGAPALFIELLFAAPRNRQWLRVDKVEQYRGVGLEFMRVAARLSLEAGCAGRLKLEASPGFVDWYRKRGLLEVSRDRIIYQGVKYTPMELDADRVGILLPERQPGRQEGT